MKKYKLIKEYPGSPELGTEIEDDEIYHSSLKIAKSGKYPEFWQEVVEKDYEILSFKYNNDPTHNGFDANLQQNGTYHHSKLYDNNTGTKLERMFQLNNYQIHSIKRLSDGEVFTVGDKLTYGTLTSINIIQNSVKLWLNFKSSGGEWDIKDMIKSKKPLFTTEDGVEMFEGDSYWCVNTNPHLWTMWLQTSKATTQINKGVLIFSTKKAAEKYIQQNKPMYSLQDIKTLCRNLNQSYIRVNFLIMELKKLNKNG